MPQPRRPPHPHPPCRQGAPRGAEGEDSRRVTASASTPPLCPTAGPQLVPHRRPQGHPLPSVFCRDTCIVRTLGPQDPETRGPRSEPGDPTSQCAHPSWGSPHGAEHRPSGPGLPLTPSRSPAAPDDLATGSFRPRRGWGPGSPLGAHPLGMGARVQGASTSRPSAQNLVPWRETCVGRTRPHPFPGVCPAAQRCEDTWRLQHSGAGQLPPTARPAQGAGPRPREAPRAGAAQSAGPQGGAVPTCPQERGAEWGVRFQGSREGGQEAASCPHGPRRGPRCREQGSQVPGPRSCPDSPQVSSHAPGHGSRSLALDTGAPGSSQGHGPGQTSLCNVDASGGGSCTPSQAPTASAATTPGRKPQNGLRRGGRASAAPRWGHVLKPWARGAGRGAPRGRSWRRAEATTRTAHRPRFCRPRVHRGRANWHLVKGPPHPRGPRTGET